MAKYTDGFIQRLATFRINSHCHRLLELAAVLDLVHEIAAVHKLHDEVEAVLKKKEER